MSHINRNSAENREYDNNEKDFFAQLIGDCLVSYTKNGEKRHNPYGKTRRLRRC